MTDFGVAMRNEILGCAFAVLALGAANVLAAELPPDLAEAVNAYDQAQIRSDIQALERLFTDDYMLVNSDASVQDKPQAIADFLVPGFKIDPYVLEQPVRIVRDDAAVIGGRVNLGWTQDGRHQTRLIRIAHVWVKRDSRWQIAYTQVTRVPQ